MAGENAAKQDKPPTVVALCDECGDGNRNHAVIVQHGHDEGDDNVQIYLHYDFQIIRCLGCGTFRFREVYANSEDMDDEGNQLLRIRVFPESKQRLRMEQPDLAKIPGKVGGIYSETVTALNAGANTLAGGGLRAVVEAICLDQDIAGANL